LGGQPYSTNELVLIPMQNDKDYKKMVVRNIKYYNNSLVCVLITILGTYYIDINLKSWTTK